jgi:hypothetical protein
VVGLLWDGMFGLDIRRRFGRLRLGNPHVPPGVGGEEARMEHFLIAGRVGLLIGFCLGVLVMRLLDLRERDELATPTRSHARGGDAWWS